MAVPLSKACCSGKVAVDLESNPDCYVQKGSYETIGGLRTYVTGKSPSTSSRAIVYVYDIFGYKPQTIRGADILASAIDGTVFMPDIFGDDAVPIDGFPFTPDAAKAFFGGPGALDKNKKQVFEFALHLQATYPNIQKMASWGLCWGGKIALCASNVLQAGKSIFVASGQAHPTQLTTADAEELTIPHLILPTKGEDAAVIAAYEAVKKPDGCETHWFPTMIHGFMGARATLNDPDVMEKYTQGYDIAGKWLAKYLA